MMRTDIMTKLPALLAALVCCGLMAQSANSSPDGQLVDYGHEFKFGYPQTPLSNSVIFGVSVAISGDTALVGAMRDQGPNGEQGAAYVLVRSGDTWTQQAMLTASDAPSGASYGHSVALSGDTALIGAPGGPGAAYVYIRSNGIWTLQQRLAPVEGSVGEQFGYAVALSGDTALVGVPSDDLGDSYGHGSAFVFTRSGVAWTEQQKLIASDVEPVNYFGSAVALDDDTAAVGAPYDTFGSNALQGSAYVFARDAGVWIEQGKLFAADGAASDLFGTAVAVSGDTVAVGVFLDDIDGRSDQGSVHVFVRSGATWSWQAQLMMADGAAHDQLGLGVAIDGDRLLAGARSDSVATSRQGSVVVYARSGSTWTQGQKIIASDGSQFDTFGHALAVSGDDLIVGAYCDEAAGAPPSTDSGSVYLFDAVPLQADLQISISNSEIQLLPGQSTIYEILIANAGPSAVASATLSNNVPNSLSNVQWTCSSVAGGAICPNAQGSGNTIAESLQLPVNGALRYLVVATVSADPGAFVTNTATIAAASPVEDSNLSNNTATDQDPVVPIGLFADGFEDGPTAITVIRY
jgi:uncharacterized repeat protein (TIGR01451 family)